MAFGTNPSSGRDRILARTRCWFSLLVTAGSKVTLHRTALAVVSYRRQPIFRFGTIVAETNDTRAVRELRTHRVWFAASGGARAHRSRMHVLFIDSGGRSRRKRG